MNAEEKYPKPTQAVLKSMRAAAAARRAVSLGLLDDVRDASRKKHAADMGVERALGRGPGAYEMQHRSVIKRAEDDVKVAEAEIARRNKIYNDNYEAQRPLNAALARCERYMTQEGVHGKPLVPHTGTVKPKRLAGETPTASVDRVRGDIAAMKAELKAVAGRPLPAKDAKAAARRQIETLAASNPPDVAPLFAGGQIKLPECSINQSRNGPLIAMGTPDARALFAWAFRDALIASINAEIDAKADDGNAMTAAEKASETTRLRAAILAAERVEEALIETAEVEGQTIHRRGDADPRAILWLADSMPEYS